MKFKKSNFWRNIDPTGRARATDHDEKTLSNTELNGHVGIFTSLFLLVYSDDNNDGIKENLHHTKFNNQKIICRYTNRST